MDTNNIKKLFDSKRCCLLTNNNAILKEPDKSAKLNKVEIKGFTDKDTVVFSLEGAINLSPYLSKDAEFQSHCDYIIVTEVKTTRYLIFVELKSQLTDRTLIVNQFKSTKCFIHYCESILTEFGNDDTLRNCKKKYIAIIGRIKPRSSTPYKDKYQDGSHSDPNSFKTIPYSGPITLRQLL